MEVECETKEGGKEARARLRCPTDLENDAEPQTLLFDGVRRYIGQRGYAREGGREGIRTRTKNRERSPGRVGGGQEADLVTERILLRGIFTQSAAAGGTERPLNASWAFSVMKAP